jgi:hypothetical protein
VSLAEWLYRYGYSRDDADKAQAAFDAESDVTMKGNVAANTFSWADDDEHDYSGEMLGCICGWLVDQLQVAEACEA